MTKTKSKHGYQYDIPHLQSRLIALRDDFFASNKDPAMTLGTAEQAYYEVALAIDNLALWYEHTFNQVACRVDIPLQEKAEDARLSKCTEEERAALLQAAKVITSAVEEGRCAVAEEGVVVCRL